MAAWPPLATTGIGSLPHHSVQAAIDFALSFDIPFLPELPQLGADEWMVRTSLSPVGGNGPPVAGRAFSLALARSPSPVAKIQMMGPVTARRVDNSENVLQRLQAQATARLKLVHDAHKDALFFLDEPTLPDDETELKRLADFIGWLRGAGAQWVGIHCCGHAPWEKLLHFKIDVLSFDVGLSMDSMWPLQDTWTRFFENGGTWCLGVVPTHPGAQHDNLHLSIQQLAERFLTSAIDMHSMMLSPACGLGLHSMADAEQIQRQLFDAQRLWYNLLESAVSKD